MREGMMTVILPAYNEEGNIKNAVKSIGDILQEASIEYRLLFIDDGSKDNTWSLIAEASKQDEHVQGLHFSRNFGKESAVYAGLCNVDSACTAVMDCDLQHPPIKLPEMYVLWQQGYDVVEGMKADRGKESVLHKAAAGTFYKMISKATGLDLQSTSDFKLLDQDVVTILRHLPERESFFRAMSFWVGFKRTSVEYEVQERMSGESKWSTSSLIKYALKSISTFSTAPMQIITHLGVLMFVVAVILGINALVQKIRGIALGGFTTVILLQLFIGSITMISIGIIGAYVAKIYTEIQHRPRFIISKSCGKENIIFTR